MKNKYLMVATLSGFLVAGAAWAQMAPPFGGPDDVKYSQALWKALTKAHMVGSHAIMSTPYKGQAPHGAVLDAIDGTVKVKGTTGAVIVKRNYGGPGVSKQAVANNPSKYLKAITVMFKRKGYDPEDKDWFWVKYNPDGSLAKNPKGMQLAGKVAKGKPKGCIACHKAAPGGDFVYNFNRIK